MSESERSHHAPFPTTHWSRVVAMADPDSSEARAALEELCGLYWYPIYALIQRSGYSAEDALDLTQEYFARLLEKGNLKAADRSKGRFRAFLKTDCGFFLSDEFDRRQALKRGGGRAVVSLDAVEAESRYRREPADSLTPDRLFDRAWALALLEDVLERLSREYRDAGRGGWFERLRVVLAEGRGSVPYAEVARELGTTEGAVQQAVSRLRKRYRALLRERIAATLETADEAAIEAEIRDLFTALE